MSELEVALVKELCIICTKEVDGSIIMNSVLTEKHAREVKELHGKVVGLAEEPCEDCKKDMEEYFILIGFDEEKSDLENLPEGFYRTGVKLLAKKDSRIVEHIEVSVPLSKEKGFCFVPQLFIDKLIEEVKNLEDESE